MIDLDVQKFIDTVPWSHIIAPVGANTARGSGVLTFPIVIVTLSDAVQESECPVIVAPGE